MITIYHNPRCMKSRETLALLEEKSEEIKIVEYLKEPPTKQQLKEILAMLGISPAKLIRKTEPDYKNNFKGKDLTDEQWIDAMLEYPKLIERPIVIKGKKAALGRPPEQVLEIL
ncbi:arsenate reductase (glutaredoxin) [Marinoscillum sp. MHG1-6]|uniref:arsenate reductase (glutaredoxin) n=1 Tax=Marinoscillum sp. MHG1-6 TaxID=2959627 RepID=UPI00215768ED|nr:arsenate reductase (glutaredoxin) [Marinoscillum sp. MHG1-6]